MARCFMSHMSAYYYWLILINAPFEIIRPIPIQYFFPLLLLVTLLLCRADIYFQKYFMR